MLLIYVPKLTNRLGYTINVVMRDILKTDFAITNDVPTFEHHEGARLCYGPHPIASVNAPYIKSTKLLFETTIEEQECHCFDINGIPALFPVYGQNTAMPFDPFAAIFFILSRYEEYLPHRKDEHGRFIATESIAYKNGFLQKAVVDRWALMLRDVIRQHYPDIVFKERSFNFIQTIDIDAAYCYLHKGFVRTFMGILRDGIYRHTPAEVKRRLRVLRGKEEDPFDTFDYIIEQQLLHKQHSTLLFFALLGDYGMYDKPASYFNNEFRQLLQHIGDFSKVGIHGSYNSSNEPKRLECETERLADILHRPIVRNRYHFLRFDLPDAFRILPQIGINHDYTMGYATQLGFRCGTCSEIPFFDLGSDQETSLILHPFATMDTTMHNYLKLSPKEAKAQYHALIDEVRAINGTFCCIFHNQNLCDDYGWQGWKEVYEDLLDYACNDNNLTTTAAL